MFRLPPLRPTVIRIIPIGERAMISRIFAALCLIPALSKPCAAQCSEWDSKYGLPGVLGTTYALQVFDDGSGPALYAGGTFEFAGGIAANNIAKWDGTSWSPLGTGLDNRVLALAVFDDGSGPALYAGGWFSGAAGVSANSIAKWDGSSWTALGSGLTSSSGLSSAVEALTVFDDGSGPALYAAGYFANAGGAPASRIAKWDGSNWTALGSGLNWWAYALTVFDDGSGPSLYVGGQFSTAGGVSADHIAKWDGATWSNVGAGTTGPVHSLAALDDGSGPALYLSANAAPGATGLVKWDGTSFLALGGGLNGFAEAIALFNDGQDPPCTPAAASTRLNGMLSVPLTSLAGMVLGQA